LEILWNFGEWISSLVGMYLFLIELVLVTLQKKLFSGDHFVEVTKTSTNKHEIGRFWWVL